MYLHNSPNVYQTLLDCEWENLTELILSGDTLTNSIDFEPDDDRGFLAKFLVSHPKIEVLGLNGIIIRDFDGFEELESFELIYHFELFCLPTEGFSHQLVFRKFPNLNTLSFNR